MLKLINVDKSYSEEVIIKNVSIDFSNPGIYVLQGVNGSGKSTILKILAGVIYKTSGVIESDVSITYLPDKFLMPKLMSVKSYLMELQDEDNIAKCEELMSKYSIPNKRIGELSKGNLQKLGLVQTFLYDTDCYLLDEPLDGLDEDTKKQVKNDIKELKEKGKIIILSLHGKTIINDLKPKIFDIKDGIVTERKRKNKNEETEFE